ncbi:hypothetical protein RB594_000634 [Gaeumannomyces avenae]
MTAPYPQVVLFGDSLFQFASELNGGFSFEAALQTYCSRRYDVVNRGFSGYNTSQALKILPQLFPAPQPSGPKLEYLIVLLGANDAAVTVPVDCQHVDMDKYRANLKTIITHPNITAHKPKILLVTPPPLDEIRVTELDLANGHPHVLRHAKISAAYSQTAREVAAEVPGTVAVDLYQEIMDYAITKTPGFDSSSGLLGDPTTGKRGYLEHLLPDGLHMSGEAYRVFFDAVVPHIKPQGPKQSQAGWTFPEWRKAPWLES